MAKVKVQVQDGGFLIGGKILFGAETPHDKYLNLAKSKWEDLRYDEFSYDLIDYPGEYDISGIDVRCFEDKNGELSYVVGLNDMKIGLIQSAKILEKEDISDMDVWLYTNEAVANRIDHMELEWEKQALVVGK